MRSCRALTVIGVALLAAGCSSGTPVAGSCPPDPGACPAVQPSFATDVGPIIQAVCQPCHSPGGQSSNLPMDDIGQIQALAPRMLPQVHSCRMPPAGAEPPLADDQRALLLEWLECGAPSN